MRTYPILVFEDFDLIGSTIVLGTLCGILFILYCLCAWQLYLRLQKQDNRHRAQFSLGYISLVFFCATALLALNTRIIQVAYINHADFPGGPYEYELLYNSFITSHKTAASTLDLLIKVLTLAIQIWRLWIIWSGTKHAVIVTILPVLLLLSYIALSIPVNMVNAMPFVQLSFSQSTVVAMVNANYGIMSSLTVLVTGLITARLLFARRQYVKIMGTSEAASPYLSIVAMLVESYILEAAWSLASVISFHLNNPNIKMLQTNVPIIKAIAHFLVVYRVETGRGWTKKTDEKLTSLQWNRGTQTATDDASC